jgi:aspartate aminotransferase-like enzyme
MLEFTVGPVMMDPEVKAVGAEDIPYFRTLEFGEMMKDNERLLKKFAYASEDTKVVFLTASGTGAMECAILNSFTSQDKVLVINGGSFGERWALLCKSHHIPYEEILLEHGQTLREKDLMPYEHQGFTALLIQGDETSTGVRYDLKMVSAFCKRNHLYYVVDAISSFLADPLEMANWGIDVLILSSQKGLSVPPGISVLLLSPKAQARAKEINTGVLYFNLPDYLLNMERGQTPFTPACGILKQIHVRLLMIEKEGGAEAEIERMADLALYFRTKLATAHLPLIPLAETPSNAVTSLKVMGHTKAHDLFDLVYKRFGIYLCPNGGNMKDTILRVGHIGHLEKKDYDLLIKDLGILNQEGIL